MQFQREITAAALALCLLIWAGCGAPGNSITDVAARRLNSTDLMAAAMAAKQLGRVEDAGFFVLASNVRRRVDNAVFPPKGKGGDSPNVLAGALNATLGSSIMETLQQNPTVFKSAIDRLSKWEAEFPANYDPGWKYESELEGEKRTATVKAETQKVLEPVLIKQRTLANDEYRGLVKLIADEDRAITQFNKSKHDQHKGVLPPADLLAYQAARKRKEDAINRVLQLEWELIPERRWHARAAWKAEEFFTDEKVIALCRAIEVSDVKKMEELISAGADVNAIGKEGMTPLLWAYPDHQLERFECLLKHGANPNVRFESDFGAGRKPFRIGYRNHFDTNDRGWAGESITLLCCKNAHKAYFDLVMKFGADPNQIDPASDHAPLDHVVSQDLYGQAERIDTLLALGANPNRYCKDNRGTPLMISIQNGLFDHALRLIQGGADPNFAPSDRLEGSIHLLVKHEKELSTYGPPRPEQFKSLVEAFESRGVSLSTAREEVEYWSVELKKVKEAKNYRGYDKSELPAIKKLIAERDAKRKKDEGDGKK